jgi:hypothetical protein
MIGAVLRALRAPIVAIALAAGGAWASAGAAGSTAPLDKPLHADLDGDGANETVALHETACFPPGGPRKPPCAKHIVRSIYVEVTDACATGTTSLQLSREMEFASLARIFDADADGHIRELAFELREGATGRGVQAKVVRFRLGPGNCVAVQKTLFSYPRPETIGRRPKGTSFQTGFLSINEFDKSVRGLELRTTEYYVRPTDAGCCPSYERKTTWRFVAASSSYKPYRTHLRRLKSPI